MVFHKLISNMISIVKDGRNGKTKTGNVVICAQNTE